MSFFFSFVVLFIQILSYAIIGRVIMSWIDQPGSMRITQILNEVTEPILAPLRSIIPSVGMFDLTPIIAMLLLQLLEGLVRGAVMGG
ncbi:MAG: YggT family protein [Roseiflexaceae bacterium]|jgi:YggT family protein|nr:YggT family protein [Chloroflexaceae bacterium]